MEAEHRLAVPPTIDEIGDARAGHVEQRIDPRLGQPFGPVAGSAMKGVEHHDREQKSQAGDNQPLQGAESEAERAIDRPENRGPRPPSHGIRDHPAGEIGDAGDNREGQHGCAGRGADLADQQMRQRCVKQLHGEDDQEERHQRQHFGDEAAHPAKHGAAADEQDDDDIKRGETHARLRPRSPAEVESYSHGDAQVHPRPSI